MVADCVFVERERESDHVDAALVAKERRTRAVGVDAVANVGPNRDLMELAVLDEGARAHSVGLATEPDDVAGRNETTGASEQLFLEAAEKLNQASLCRDREPCLVRHHPLS